MHICFELAVSYFRYSNYTNKESSNMISKNKKYLVSDIWIPSAIPIFLFGFIYYLITPFISLVFFADYSLISAALPYIDLNYFDFYYWLDTFSILFFFIIGYKIGSKIKIRKKSYLDKFNNYKAIPLLVFCLLFIYYLFILVKVISSGLMFSGYATYDIEILGPASTIIFTTVFFYNFFKNPLVKRLFLVLFFLNAITLLGLGSRMYFTISLISVVLGYISFNRNLLTSARLYLVLSVFLVFIVGIGVWRSNGQIDKEALISVFLAEPLFTSTSGSLYIENSNGRPIFSIPTDIVASIINFVPSVIYPNKIEVIDALTYDINKQSPFGANSLIANLYSNFGFFYPLYLIFIGFYLGFLKHKADYSRFYKAVYFSTLPTLIFHFYREGFITFIKIMFFNGLIFPTIFLALIGILTSYKR